MRVLLVEDQPKHRQDAVVVLKSAGIEFVIAKNESEALASLSQHSRGDIIDGVLTDLFVPHSDEEPWNEADQPCGLAIALEAEALGLPFQICTAGFRHAANYDWICKLGRRRGWPEMVDGRPDGDIYRAEAGSKDWVTAASALLGRITDRLGPCNEKK